MKSFLATKILEVDLCPQNSLLTKLWNQVANPLNGIFVHQSIQPVMLLFWFPKRVEKSAWCCIYTAFIYKREYSSIQHRLRQTRDQTSPACTPSSSSFASNRRKVRNNRCPWFSNSLLHPHFLSYFFDEGNPIPNGSMRGNRKKTPSLRGFWGFLFSLIREINN